MTATVTETITVTRNGFDNNRKLDHDGNMKPLEMNFSSEGDEQKETPSFSSFDNETQFISCTAVGSSPPPMMTMMTKPNKKKMMAKKTVRPMVFVSPASTTSASTSTTDTPNTNHRSDDNIRRSQLYVEGICCAAEVPIVTDILYRSFPKQVQNIQINVNQRIVSFDHNEKQLSIQDISQMLSNEGFESQILNTNTIVKSCLRHLHVILSGIFWVMSMLNFIGHDRELSKYTGLLSVLFGLPPVMKKGMIMLRKRKQLDMNMMVTVAALGAVCMQQYDEAASVSFLYSISKWWDHESSMRKLM